MLSGPSPGHATFHPEAWRQQQGPSASALDGLLSSPPVQPLLESTPPADSRTRDGAPPRRACPRSRAPHPTRPRPRARHHPRREASGQAGRGFLLNAGFPRAQTPGEEEPGLPRPASAARRTRSGPGQVPRGHACGRSVGATTPPSPGPGPRPPELRLPPRVRGSPRRRGTSASGAPRPAAPLLRCPGAGGGHTRAGPRGTRARRPGSRPRGDFVQPGPTEGKGSVLGSERGNTRTGRGRSGGPGELRAR